MSFFFSQQSIFSSWYHFTVRTKGVKEVPLERKVQKILNFLSISSWFGAAVIPGTWKKLIWFQRYTGERP